METVRVAGSWGRVPGQPTEMIPLRTVEDPIRFPAIEAPTVLPRGNGRSYGDSCLNDGGALLDSRPLDRIVSFDRERGVLRAEAGVLLSRLLERIVPAGFFLPVVPGTKYVTLGGAIANDVHGKNHQHAGTLGCHVRAFELLRSDGSRHLCSAESEPGLFAATIGGLGLTGVILWAEVDLKRAPGRTIEAESILFDTLEEFVDLCRESDETHEYTVAWIDGTAPGSRIGRGVFTRGELVPGDPPSQYVPPAPKLTVPVRPPVSLVRPWTMRVFNTLYLSRQRRKPRLASVDIDPFFFPLDSVGMWNRLYGAPGFLQYQFVVPTEAIGVVDQALRSAREAHGGASLAVAKRLGTLSSPGTLSFPMPGVTLAMDLPDRAERSRRLLDRLDRAVADAGGRVYPAKDACMSADSFRAFYPHWESLLPWVDPRFSSSFWRRVEGDRGCEPF